MRNSRMTGNPEVMRALGRCSDRFRFADHSSRTSSFASDTPAVDPQVGELQVEMPIAFKRTFPWHEPGSVVGLTRKLSGGLIDSDLDTFYARQHNKRGLDDQIVEDECRS